jgi:hypothetical protein
VEHKLNLKRKKKVDKFQKILQPFYWKCRLVVYVSSLENCRVKASWVRIPPLPPQGGNTANDKKIYKNNSYDLMPQRVKNLISNRKTYTVIIITLLIGLIAAGIVIYNITKKPPTVQKTEQKAETKPKSITDPIVSGDQQKPVAPTPPQLETPKIK